MPLIGRIIRNPESALFSNCWNELAYFSKKTEAPLPPKRPMSAYMIFCQENRKELLKENPALRSTEQIKILAGKWNQLTLDLKKPFQIMARERTLLYGEEHKKFYENLSEDQKEEFTKLKADKRLARRLLKLNRALKESNFPKPPATTAYAFFVHVRGKEKRDIKPSARPQDFIKHIAEKWKFSHEDSKKNFIKETAEMWKSLPEEKKKSFEEQMQAEKLRYECELEQWKQNMAREGKLDLLKQYDQLKGRKSLLSGVVDTPGAKTEKSRKTKQQME